MATERDLEAAREASARARAALEEIQEPSASWAREKLPTIGRFRSALEEHLTEDDEGFPEGWHESAAVQLLLGALFGSPATVARFLRDAKAALTPRARELALASQDVPWRFTSFELRGSYPDDLHECLDHDSGEPFLLDSPGVSTLSREGCRVFLSLLLDAGPCRLAFSTVHYFRGFQGHDFAAFARGIEPQLYAGRGLSAVIGRHPELFLLLSLYSEIPPQVFRGTPLVICADWHEAEALPPVAHPERLESRSSGHLTQLALPSSEPDAPYYPQHGLLFHDAKKRLVLATAMGTARYGELVEAAGPAWGLSPLPTWKAGMTMVVAMRRLLGKDPPGSQYVARFEGGDDGGRHPELDRINALMADMSRRHNAGVPYSVDDLAGQHGVEPELARQVDRTFRQTLERHGIQSRGEAPAGFEGLAPPPDALRRFHRTLEASPLFDLDASQAVEADFRAAAAEAERARPGGGRRGEIRRMVALGRLGIAAVPRFIEEEFLRALARPDVSELNCLLYLLLRAGSEPRDTAAYAAAVRRAFGRSPARAGAETSPGRFLSLLERYLAGVLEPLGLVSTGTGEAGQRVQSTPLFRRWIRLSAYWE